MSETGTKSKTVQVVKLDGSVRPMDEIEREILYVAIIACGGNVSAVASGLKIGRSTLYRKVKDYGLEGVVQSAASARRAAP